MEINGTDGFAYDSMITIAGEMRQDGVIWEKIVEALNNRGYTRNKKPLHMAWVSSEVLRDSRFSNLKKNYRARNIKTLFSAAPITKKKRKKPGPTSNKDLVVSVMGSNIDPDHKIELIKKLL